MEVKPGYKQTEVGIIPEEWEVAELGSIASFSSGSGISVAALHGQSTGFPVPVFGGNGIAGYTRTPLVSEKTVVIGRVGQKCGEVYVTDGPAWISDNALFPKRMQRDCDLTFFGLALKAAGLNDVKNRNDLPLLTQAILHAKKIAWPPNIDEQRAIAAALSDVDEILGGLEQLIAKKRDLKQAAMQQLLTGQTRLPGYHGEWKPKKLGELLKYERPDKFTVGSADYEDKGDTPVLTANKSFILGFTNEKFGIYANLPVIVFDDFTTDSKYADFPFKVKSSAIKILSPRDENVNLKFVFERMRLLEFPLGEHKRYYISEYQHIEILMPEPDEQTAVAAVLSDMDADIAMLERRREKTRDLKQAMMQELLTGKTRLVVAGEPHARTTSL